MQHDPLGMAPLGMAPVELGVDEGRDVNVVDQHLLQVARMT